MVKYINEAKAKATENEFYAIKGVARRRYANGELIIVFSNLYDRIHNPIAYYNCLKGEFVTSLR